jgi:general secretion pathway protein I
MDQSVLGGSIVTMNKSQGLYPHRDCPLVVCPPLQRDSPHAGTVPSKCQGFTLLEMIVALAVFSIAALALLRLEGATVKNAGEVETRTLGQIVANNVAVDALTDPLPPPLGKSEGSIDNAGRKWRWVRTATRTADARIIRIDIAVIDQNGRSAGRLSLARVAQ